MHNRGKCVLPACNKYEYSSLDNQMNYKKQGYGLSTKNSQTKTSKVTTKACSAVERRGRENTENPLYRFSCLCN